MAVSYDIKTVVIFAITVTITVEMLSGVSSSPISRQTRMAPDQRQLTITIKKSRQFIKSIRTLYKSPNFNKIELRGFNEASVKKLLKLKTTEQNIHRIITILIENLVILKNVKINTDNTVIFNKSKRKQIYELAEKNVLILQTEIEEFMKRKKIGTNEILKNNILVDTSKAKSFAQIKMIDLSFSKIMNNILLNCRKVLTQSRRTQNKTKLTTKMS